MGVIPPVAGFLEAIVSECARHGAVSVFDEVMTGCRLARGGMQERASVRPDMTCLGKIVGGGLPLAAYGGKRAIMGRVSPMGPVYQAGTLSGNPVAISAGLATLDQLDDAVYAHLEALGARLEDGFTRAIAARAANACVQRVGSMLTLFFARAPIRSYTDASRCDTDAFARWHRAMLERHVYWPPSQFEAAFIGAAHTDADIDETIAAADDALARVA
jgi:glutamate-1-semialdehyde 2,1-aminomutase